MTFVLSFMLHALNRIQKHGNCTYWYMLVSAPLTNSCQALHKCKENQSQCLETQDMSLDIHMYYDVVSKL